MELTENRTCRDDTNKFDVYEKNDLNFRLWKNTLASTEISSKYKQYYNLLVEK